jgi:putative membrane protein
MDHSEHATTVLLALPFVAAMLLYALAVHTSRARRPWPWWRPVLWCAGLVSALLAVVGPLAERSDESFVAHMVGHVLLGMVAPLLLVLSAPVTLALRALPVRAARSLVRVLASAPLRFLTHPVTAAVLSLGGLWVLYATPLFGQLQTSELVHALVHAHVLIWGYLLTAAIVGVDPDPRRLAHLPRAAAFTAYAAGHAILAKFLYAHPPTGVGARAAERGAMVMYYGGDLTDVATLVLLGHSWYVSSRPSRVATRASASPVEAADRRAGTGW